MKLHTVYNIIVNDIIVDTSSSFGYIKDAFDRIRKSEPHAWIQTCYC